MYLNSGYTIPNDLGSLNLYAIPTPDSISTVDNTHSSVMKTAAYSPLYTDIDGHPYTVLRKDNSLSPYATSTANVNEQVYTNPTTNYRGSTSSDTDPQYTVPSTNATEDSTQTQ